MHACIHACMHSCVRACVRVCVCDVCVCVCNCTTYDHCVNTRTVGLTLPGWIDQSQVLTIPSCLGTEFAVAEGMRGATRDEWADYKNMFSRSVRHIDFHLVQAPPR